MVHGELEDQCQTHPAGVALSAGTNQVNSPRFLKSPTLRVLTCVSPFSTASMGSRRDAFAQLGEEQTLYP